MQLKGSVEIRVIDSRTNECKQIIKQDNLITNRALVDILGMEPTNIFVGPQFDGNNARVAISSSTAKPSILNLTVTGVLAIGYVPSGVTSPTFNTSANPVFGQIQNRIDFIGSPRIFNTVALIRTQEQTNSTSGSRDVYAYLRLDTPCTQDSFDFLDIFYRVQFVNSGGQGLSNRALVDFGSRLFGLRRCRFFHLHVSPFNTPNINNPYQDLYVDDNSSVIFSARHDGFEYDWDSSNRIDNHFKFKFRKNWELNERLGFIFNSMLQGLSNNFNAAYSNNSLTKNISPLQNLFSHSSNATVPFFDSLRLASGNGKVILGGDWVNKWPELYRLTITDSGATGVSKYKWSVRKHLGFNGNTYSDRTIENPFRNPNTPAFEKCHGWRDENNDVLRYSATQVVQYDDTGVTLVDLVSGAYQSWDTTTTPGLFLVSQIRQCATDGSKIYAACRLTGLWVIDVANNSVSHPITAPCFGVDIGRNGVAYTIADGALSCSTDWAAPLPFIYAGVTDNNWSNVQFLKCDPENVEDRLAIVMQVPNTNNRRVIWHRVVSPSIPAGEFKFDNFGDSGGVAYWAGTNYGTTAWTNPHTAGRVTCVMSTTEQGAASNLVNRNGGANHHTQNIANSWESIDLGEGNQLVLKSYLFQNRPVDNQYAIRNWRLQGSNNVIANTVAALAAATWVDIDIRVNDTTMPNVANAWGVYSVSSSTPYRWFRVLQDGINASGTNHLMVSEFEFYGTFNSTTPSRIPPSGRLLDSTFTGVESTNIELFAASLDVSDSGDFWVAGGVGKLNFGNSVTSALGITLASQQLTHSIFGSDRYYKITFYKNFLIGRSQIVNDMAQVQNSYSDFGDKTFILHMDGGIVLTNREMRQMFTDNAYCWDNYGWNGTAWELNNVGTKFTHVGEQPLLNGITAKFENGVNAPHFNATDFYTQGVCNGILKDNATTIYYESAWYSKPAQFNHLVQAGATVPASPTLAPTTTKYWRVKSKVPATGIDKRWYIRELIFRNSAGADITTGGSVSVSHPDNATYRPEFAVNKSIAGQFTKVSDQELGWIAYTFATDVTVTQVSIANYNDTTHNIPPISYVVESSIDGIIWLELWEFTTGIADGTYYNSTYNPPTNSAPGVYPLKLSAADDSAFVRLETDSVELTKLTINGVAPATVYTTEPTAIGPNEVYVDGSGALYFNAAQSGSAIAGTYAWIKN